MRLYRFAGARGEYIFPSQTDLQSNFGNLLTRTTKIYMMNGAIDDYNGRRTPQDLGNISVGMWLIGDPWGSVRGLKDEAFKMAGWGTQRLFIRPEDESGIRWAWSRVANIRGNENVKNLPHLKQKIDVDFQIANPVWLGTRDIHHFCDTGMCLDSGHSLDGMAYLDDCDVLDSGDVIAGIKAEYQIVGSSAEFDVSNEGNHGVKPLIKVGGLSGGWLIGDGTIIGDAPALYFGGVGQAVSDITIKCKQYGRVVDEIYYAGVIGGGEWVEINCDKNTVIKHGVNGIESAYANFSAVQGFGFTEIASGDMTFEVSGTFNDAGCYVSVDFFDGWY
jgi:hypothetical protein